MKFKKYLKLILVGFVFSHIQTANAAIIDISTYNQLKSANPASSGDELRFLNNFDITGQIGFYPGVFDLKFNGNGKMVTVKNNNVIGFVIYEYVKYEINNLVYDGGNIALSSLYANPLYIASGTGILNNSTFKNSYVTNRHGGAVYNENKGTLLTDKSTFSNNKVGDNYWGGAVANKGTATIKGSAFSNNQITNSSGGAIYNSGKLTIESSDDGTLTTFSNNRAPGWGGAIINENTADVRATFTQNTAGSGGAIFQLDYTTLNLYKNSVFESNTATGSDVLNSGGGAIFNQGTIDTVSEIGGSQIRFDNNTAVNSSGGAIYNAREATVDATFNSNSASYGGAIFNKENLNVTEGSSFNNNKASSYGGALYNQSKSNITGTTFNGNEAGSGGAIWNEAGTLKINAGSSFNENKATGYAGGAIYNKGNANITADFEKNTASAGGAIYNTTANAVLNINSKSSFSENESSQGGAIYNENGTANITGTTFEKNDATYSGGAINNASGNVSVSGGEFNANNSGTSGGAIFNGGGTSTIKDSSFDSNTSDAGGAISNANGTLNISDTNFTNNSASTAGGAIYQNGGTTNINLVSKDVEFSGNTAAGVANDIHIESGTLNIQTNGNTLTLDSGLSGTGTVNKNGNGTLSLNGVNSNFSGDLNVNGGRLSLGSSQDGAELVTAKTNGKLIFADNTSLATKNEIIDNKLEIELNGNTTFEYDIDTSSNTADNLDVKGTGALTLSLFKFINGQNLTDNETVVKIIGSNTGSITLEKADVKVYTNDFEYSYGDIVNGDSVTIIKNEFSGDVLAKALTDTSQVRGLELLNDYQFDTFNNAGIITMPIEMAAGTLTINGNGHSINAQNVRNPNEKVNLFITDTGDTLIINNVSEIKNAYTQGSGSVLNNNSGNVYILNSKVIDNSSDDNGGAIYNSGEGFVGLKGTEFVNNTSKGNGGAIYNTDNATLAIDGSEFTNNKSNDIGGAIYNTGNASLDINDSQFTNNTSNNGGGAIYNTGSANLAINGSKFTNNTSNGNGGAIYNDSTQKVHLSNSKFVDNITKNTTPGTSGGGSIFNASGTDLEISSSEFSFENVKFTNSSGGAIYNDAGADLLINNGTTFKNLIVNIGGNTLGGGAIYNAGNTKIDGTKGAVQFIDNASYGSGGAITNIAGASLNIQKAIFNNNGASKNGGAINNFSELNVSQSIFEKNFANQSGGAIYNNGGQALNFDNLVFKTNSAVLHGGAVSNNSGDLDIKNTSFINNFAGNGAEIKMGIGGGAVFNETGQSINISNSEFRTNSAFGNGGAIYNKGILNVKNSYFTNNTIRDVGSPSSDSFGGGAIYNDGGTITLENVSLENNAVIGNEGASGGAIYNNNNGVINLIANGKNVVFLNNMVNYGSQAGSVKNDIHLESGTLNLNASKGNTIVLGGGITSSNDSNELNINGTSSGVSGGQVFVDGAISNTKMNFYNGTLSLGKTEYISGNHLGLSGGQINMGMGSISTANLPSLHLENGTTTGVAINADLANAQVDRFSTNNTTGTGLLNINGIRIFNDSKEEVTHALFADASFKDNVTLGVKNVYGPMYKYGVEYLQQNGNLAFSNKGFRPGVISGPVAAQAGAYLAMLNNYTEAFGNMDMVLLLPKEQQQALLYKNKLATVGSQYAYNPTMFPEEKKGFWTRPFTTFENVPLKNGPTVSNVLYGSLFGEDSELKDLGHGFKGFYSGYLGYNGSHQAYDGVGIYQNGGLLGATYQVYKDNFFSGLTVNAGGSTGEASTEFGSDNFTMLSAGIASKTGYNWKLLDERLVIQPNLLMSYSFIQTFDYKTASGIDISNGALNAIQVTPGIKIVGNLKNYWQPYLAVNMVFNVFDKAAFKANETYLPQLSIKPYIEYGLGVQKRWGERFTGFSQFMIRNGGRNGIALQLGLRWSLGK